MGDEKLVIYLDAVTNNVSIRANFNISGNAANKSVKTKGLFYSTHFLQAIEEYWSGIFGQYNVSTYTGQSINGIKVNISQVDLNAKKDYSHMHSPLFGWSLANPGRIDMFTGDSRTGTIYTVSQFRGVAAHEFGHILGVDDMYTNPNYAGMNSIFNNFGSKVYEGDIAMVLQAYSTGRWQKWT